MSQTNRSSRRITWGFLAFALGCIIAISGAAKLHPSEKMMRARGMMERGARRIVAKALAPAAANAQETLIAARLDQLSDAQMKALLQTTLRSMLQHAANTFFVKAKGATQGQLSPKVLDALLAMWNAPHKSGSAPGGKANVLSQIQAGLLQSLSKGKLGARKAAGSVALVVAKEIKEIVAILRDNAVKHMVPYIIRKGIQQQTRERLERLALDRVAPQVKALALIGVKQHSPREALKALTTEAERIVSSFGKALKIKAEDRAIPSLQATIKSWADTLAPALPRVEALQKARKLAGIVARTMASAYAPRVSTRVAKRLRLEWKAGAKAGSSAPSTARPVARKTDTSSPRPAPTTRKAATTRPVGALARRVPPPRRPTVTAPSHRVLVLGGEGERIGGWPDSLPIFLFGTFLALVGLGFWRNGAKAEAELQLQAGVGEEANPFALLANVQAPLRQLQNDIESLSTGEVCDRVDEILSQYILPFAEVRRGVIDRLGMENGAEILVTVAYGERTLNRVWSAASDGHLPEAIASLPDAVSAFAEAADKAQQLNALPTTTKADSDEGSKANSDKGSKASDDEQA